MLVLWPSFLTAVLAVGSFFSLFDPHEAVRPEVAATLSPIGVYTIGFFFFWALCALASTLTYYLAALPDDRPPQ